MTSLEVAGVAGTWVAAGLAVVALIGIAGQIVAWRTSRTERYKAISAVGPVNYGFIGKGWWAGPNTRVYRRIAAPDIKDEKLFANASQVWTYERYEHLSDSLRTSSWVQFGGLLKCYKFDLRYGNVLDIQGGRTWLPIHRSYLMAIGILGRVGRRPDRGKWDGRASRVSFYSRDHERDRDHHRGRDRELGRRPTVDSAWGPTYYGITAAIQFHESRQGKTKEVLYTPQSKDDIGMITAEQISLREMFLMAVGCIPSGSEECYWLADSFLTFEENEDVYASSLLSDDPDDGPALDRPTHITRIQAMVENNSDLGELADLPEADEMRALELIVISELDPRLERLAKPFSALPAREKIKTLGVVRLDRETLSSLKNLSDATYLPATADWIRIPRGKQSYRRDSNVKEYIRRRDGQSLALALLNIKWHPEGYIIGGISSQHRSIRFLTSAGSTKVFILFITRLQLGIETLGLTLDQKRSFFDSAKNVKDQLNIAKKWYKERKSRSLMQALYLFQQNIKSVVHKSSRANQMIGILMISNAEFFALVLESARFLETAGTMPIDIDLTAGTIKVLSGFGVTRTFVVDVDILSPGPNRGSTPEAKATILHTHVLMASLEACLTSVMLNCSFDADRFVSEVLECDEVLFMG
ncbi:hypothetical protein MMC30_005718 [Trapelia coarctata]|nr:hypothetical protein [Trapelia coarctata]